MGRSAKKINIIDILSVSNFSNETDVREDFVSPLLKALGYSNSGNHKIERNIYLKIPELIIGRKKKYFEKYSPDYILNVNGKRKWVIDAKGPDKSVENELYISQTYSYSIHREVNVPYFVICNGKSFAVYNTKDQSYSPVTVFDRKDLQLRWEELYQMFSVDAFKERQETQWKVIKNNEYKKREKEVHIEGKVETPIDRVIEPKKQGSPIHHGPHPYFTKRPWNVVREYIEHFCKKGDIVLDPYGGSGITAIEAIILGRKAVHMDINPISNFMTDALAVPVGLSEFGEEFRKVKNSFEKEWRAILRNEKPKLKHWYPANVKLPKDADVLYLHEYFTTRQLAAMASLRNLISKIKNKDIKKVFMLIFSSTLVKCNKSYHNTPRTSGISGGGDAGFLKYYRYQIPKKLFPEQSPVEVFESKFKAMFKAKRELNKIQSFDYKNLQIIQGSALNLNTLRNNSIDYIFTDPPYGAKISYLDCSTLWNSWLKLSVNDKMFEEEVISGGSKKKTDEQYIKLLQRSLKEIYRVLKPNCWFSIVFASENPKFWHAIRDYCIGIGFEHVNTVCQPSKRRTVKKNQNPLTVFKGELILNFRKMRSNRNVVCIESNLSPKQYVLNSAELTIVSNEGSATIEQIMEDLIPKLWESGLLGAVSNEIDDINKILKASFDYDTTSGKWTLKKKTRLGCHIPLENRMKFYLMSCLNKAKSESKKLTIDEIIMSVIPYLRNGITPSNQQIIKELKKIAISRDDQRWELNISDQLKLF